MTPTELARLRSALTHLQHARADLRAAGNEARAVAVLTAISRTLADRIGWLTIPCVSCRVEQLVKVRVGDDGTPSAGLCQTCDDEITVSVTS